MENAKQFLDYVVRSLVQFPDDVQIEAKTDDMGVLLTLYVAPEDMGKVIGKAGETAKAIRNLLRVVGMKDKARINMKIAEPANG